MFFVASIQAARSTIRVKLTAQSYPAGCEGSAVPRSGTTGQIAQTAITRRVPKTLSEQEGSLAIVYKTLLKFTAGAEGRDRE